ncbi:BRCA1-A complex subunit Abraxas 1 isoform X2 [Stigmatopora argus]
MTLQTRKMPKQADNMAEPAVHIPGIVFASFLFQHANRDSDVEGLLLGETHMEQHVTISDTQEDQVRLTQTYSVHKHVCCSQLNSWYDAAGRVDVASLRRVLGADPPERVIGWYRQRRNSEQRMSMRETAVHRSLKAALRRPVAVFLLVTPGAEAGSTHRTEYSAFLSGDRQVPVVLTNMASLDHQAYWTAPAASSAASYRRAVARHSSKLLDAGGQLADVDAINAMNGELQHELRTTCGAVADSERALQKILLDVSALKRKLSERKSTMVNKEGAPVAKRNVCLQLAVRALLADSPLFATHALTLDARPVAQVKLRPSPTK